MDADKQNLYFAHMSYEEITKTLDEYHSHFANYSLINNCRNSQAIIEKIDSIFGTHTKFRRMEMRGTDVLIRGYKKSQDQVEIVEFILRQLMKEQTRFDDIEYGENTSALFKTLWELTDLLRLESDLKKHHRAYLHVREDIDEKVKEARQIMTKVSVDMIGFYSKVDVPEYSNSDENPPFADTADDEAVSIPRKTTRP